MGALKESAKALLCLAAGCALAASGQGRAADCAPPAAMAFLAPGPVTVDGTLDAWAGPPALDLLKWKEPGDKATWHVGDLKALRPDTDYEFVFWSRGGAGIGRHRARSDEKDAGGRILRTHEVRIDRSAAWRRNEYRFRARGHGVPLVLFRGRPGGHVGRGAV